MPQFPKRASLTSHFVSSDNPNLRSNRAALRREAGVFVLDADLEKNDRLNDPDHVIGDPATLNRLPQVALTLIQQLDPLDPAYRAKYRGIVAHYAPVWEDVGGTPLVIDFTNVMEPITPKLRHPSHPDSKHPERPLHVWAKKLAFQHDGRRGLSGTQSRNEWYWEQMDKGLLPPHFNPYVPNSQRHNAFEERVDLRDDRPTAANSFNPNLPVLQTPHQIRKRARRKMARGESLSEDELEVLCSKPVGEWSMEELAKGYPRLPNGHWPPRPPGQYVQIAMREKIDRQFKLMVKGSMNVTTVDALKVLSDVLHNEDTDNRGKPHVSASTKVDAAKFLVEHLLGKPKQTVENDISVKLQGILAGVMISPEMSIPSQPELPVGPTGRMLAGQRGQRQDYDDTELNTLRDLGVIDAELVEEDEE